MEISGVGVFRAVVENPLKLARAERLVARAMANNC
jgi:hypothetical protein